MTFTEIPVSFEYSNEVLHLVFSTYQNTGATAVSAVDADGAPYATISVNFPESKALPTGVFYLKTWSENEGIARALIDQNVIEAANPFLYPPIRSGFVTARAYKMTGATTE